MDSSTMGQRLQHVRKEIGLTQDQVAKHLGMKREGISYIETGTRVITTGMLQKLADLYGYRMSYFLGEEVEGKGPQVSMAFRISDLRDDDLAVISNVKRIAVNLDKLYELLGVDTCA